MVRVSLNQNVNKDFEYSGNNLPINLNDTSLYVMALLNDYDKRMKNGDVPKINPYKDRLVMQMENGKFVEVPYEIQSEAVKKWLATPIKGGTITRINQLDTEDDLADDIDDSFLFNIIKVIVVLIIVVMIVYFVSLSNKVLL